MATPIQRAKSIMDALKDGDMGAAVNLRVAAAFWGAYGGQGNESAGVKRGFYIFEPSRLILGRQLVGKAVDGANLIVFRAVKNVAGFHMSSRMHG